MAGARAVVQEERLVRRHRLRIADEPEGTVGDVGGEVVPLFRRRRLVDRVVVVDQVRVRLVGHSNGTCPLEFGKPAAASVMLPMLLVV